MRQYDVNLGLLDVVRNHTLEMPISNKIKTPLKRRIKNEMCRMRPTILLRFEKGTTYIAEINFISRISGFFNILLNNPFIIQKQNVIDLPHTNSKDFHEIMDLALTLEEKNSINHVKSYSTDKLFKILDIASFYQITIILESISIILLQRINDTNLCELYEFFKCRIPKISKKLENIIFLRMEILINNTSAFLKLKQDSFLYFIFNPKTSIPIFTELFLLRMYVKIGQSVNRDVSLIINEQAKILNNTVDCCKIVDKRIPSKTILAIGGYCPTIEPRISAFDPNTQTWVDIPEEYCKGMPNLYYHKSLQVNRDIYFVGGCTVNGMPLDTATKWDMDDFSWSPLPRMFHRRNFLSLESYGNRHIYAIGGSNGRQRLKNVEVFDIHHQCWKPASKMNFARSDGTSVFIDNHIYAIGGYNGQFVQNSVEFYDVTKDEWYIFGSSMKHFRRGHSAVGIQNCIYVAGGFGSHRLNSLEMIDIREGKWHFLNPMFKSRSNFSMSKFECGMYALGGCDQQSSIIDDSEKYDIIAGKWKPCSSLKYKLSAHSSIVLEYDTAIKSLLNYNL